MSAKMQRDARVAIRLPAEWKADIKRAATIQGVTVTDFATSVLREAARKVQVEQTQDAHIRLSIRDRDRFLAMLDNPPAPNAALKAAFKRSRRRAS